MEGSSELSVVNNDLVPSFPIISKIHGEVDGIPERLFFVKVEKRSSTSPSKLISGSHGRGNIGTASTPERLWNLVTVLIMAEPIPEE